MDASTRDNPFCHDSKISEIAFVSIFEQFLKGRTASEAAEVLERVGVTSISRQTISFYFDKIGRWLYQYFVPSIVEKKLSEESYKNCSFEECEAAFVEVWWKSTNRKRINSASVGESQPEFGAQIFELLKQRKRKFKNISRETFKSHVGFMLARMALIHISEVLGVPISDEMEFDFFMGILSEMKAHPL